MIRKKAHEKVPIRWVAVSGGFDPLHVGHARMFQEARLLGNRLVVILNNDNWLTDKKGFAFMPQGERAELVQSFPSVDKVVITNHSPGEYYTDKSVVRELRELKPHIFANGGDRFADNIPEAILCKELGIEMVFNIGKGGKMQSSSHMVGVASRDVRRSKRPWGEFYGWDKSPNWYLKTLYVKPGKRLSLQYHHHRSEIWTLVEGDAKATTGTDQKNLKTTTLTIGEPFFVPQGTIHRLESEHGGTLVEIALGTFDENDIVRLEDDFGRLRVSSPYQEPTRSSTKS